MVIYIVVFSMSLLLFYMMVGSKTIRLNIFSLIKSKRKLEITQFGVAVFLSSLPPMFISAVRYFVGTDYYKTYYTGFYRTLDGSVVDRFEPGFYLLNRIIQLFSDNAFWMFVITSMIFVGVVYKAIAILSIDVPLSIILFFVTRYYFVGMNGVRQFIGIAILTYSLKYIFEREPIRFGICVFLACMFHYSCILFALVYFMSKYQLTKRRVFIMIVASFTCFSFGIPLVIRILSETRYGSLVAKYHVAGIKFSIFTMALNVVLFIVGYYFYNERKDDLRYCVYLNLQFLAMLSTFGLRSIPLMERIYWMFSFPIIISVPYLLAGFSNPNVRRLFRGGLVIILSIYMFYDICILGDHGVLPYRWIFGESASHYSGWDWYGGFFR